MCNELDQKQYKILFGDLPDDPHVFKEFLIKHNRVCAEGNRIRFTDRPRGRLATCQVYYEQLPARLREILDAHPPMVSLFEAQNLN